MRLYPAYLLARLSLVEVHTNHNLRARSRRAAKVVATDATTDKLLSFTLHSSGLVLAGASVKYRASCR